MRFDLIQEPQKVQNDFKIHNIHIVDVSGSMSGSKYSAAIEGIKKEVEEMQKGGFDNMTVSVVEFDTHFSKCRITKPLWLNPLMNIDINNIKFRSPEGLTPLLEATTLTINELLLEKNPNDRVIITIFTDGQENASSNDYSGPKLKELIKKVEVMHNMTVTFMGTETDVLVVQKMLNLSKDNTLSHNNTKESILSAYSVRAVGLTSYSKSVNSGDLVTTDSFFKTTN